MTCVRLRNETIKRVRCGDKITELKYIIGKVDIKAVKFPLSKPKEA